MKISFWDVLTGILMFAGFGVVLVFANIFIDPYTILNPFPPPTIQPTIKVPTMTPTLRKLPAIWTATPTGNVQTTTLLPSLTPIASKTGFTLAPTNTFTPIPSLTPVGTITPTRTNTPLGGKTSTPTRTRTPTNSSSSSFAISSVRYVAASPSSWSGTCPKSFSMSADIYYSGDGTITYYWIRSSDNAHLSSGSFDTDGTSPDSFSATLTSGTPGFVNTSTYSLYIDNPNHQQFGGVDIAMVCSADNLYTPIITSNGGGTTATIPVNENITAAITTVTATDADASSTLTYTIIGGADSGLFTLNSSSGVLTFTTAPNYEGAGDNSYEVIVQVSDGLHTDSQTITVNVANINEAPVITSNGGGDTGTATTPENSTAVTTVTATDQDAAATQSYSIAAGGDGALFTIVSGTGVLTFISAPDYETRIDSDANNVYDVTVQVTDGSLTDTQAIAVTVTDENDLPPVFTSSTTFSIAENSTSVGNVTASDGDTGPTLAYSITGGADASLFDITTGGVLTFKNAHDYENPTDGGTDNVYDVTVQVTDTVHPVTQNIAVTVTNVDEAPTVTKAFSPNPITVTIGISTLTITIANTSGNAVGLTGVAFTDAFPGGMEVAADPNESSTDCGSPTFTPLATNTSLTFSGGTIAIGASCVVEVDVIGTTTGAKDNSTSVVTSSEADDGAAASATLTVDP